jgi:hypothetical protein
MGQCRAMVPGAYGPDHVHKLATPPGAEKLISHWTGTDTLKKQVFQITAPRCTVNAPKTAVRPFRR